MLDKNNEIRYIESLWIGDLNRYKTILFRRNFRLKCNSNISNKLFIIILFGGNFDKILGFHLPYLLVSRKKYKLLVDNDKEGNKIINWFKKIQISIMIISRHTMIFIKKLI